jgi:hypothetical protein
VQLAVNEGAVDLGALRPQANWCRIGRYLRFGRVGAWIGTNFALWSRRGGTPLWLVFGPGEFSRVAEVRPLLEPWAINRDTVFEYTNDGYFCLGLRVVTGEEKDAVVRSIANELRHVADAVRLLPPATTVAEPSDE